MFCTKCGKENTNESKFCFNCGENIFPQSVNSSTLTNPVPSVNKKKGKFYKYFGMSGFAFLVLVLIAFNSSIKMVKQPNVENKMDNTSTINEAVRVIKASITLPSKVDEVTDLVDVTAEPNAVRYHYVLSGADTSKLSGDYLKNYLSSSVCKNNTIKKLLDQGINIDYYFLVDGSNENYSVSFSKEDCLTN